MESAMLRENEGAEFDRYAWQQDIPGFGADGQEKLRRATVLISRCGGVGGMAAMELAAAGVGRLILAHAGELRLTDLNRQILMKDSAVGSSRIDCAAARLREFNPQIEVIPLAENATAQNASRLVNGADVVVDAAPLFEERLALNAACAAAGIPLVEAAMFSLEGTLTTIVPGRTACLACWCESPPSWWRRRFPVFGAVSGAVGCLAALEVIKLLTGIPSGLEGRLLACDFARNRFRTIALPPRREDCPVCAGKRAPDPARH
jgi:molybdopterin/thiamine biosynthesis adenylyltransferase